MTSLAMKFPIAGIIAASGLGAGLFAELTPAEYATPGVIIAVLFGFIGTCSLVLYKVVLNPLFTVFIKNLETASEDRSKFLQYVIDLNKEYAANMKAAALDSASAKTVMEEMKAQLTTLTKTTNKQVKMTREQETNGVT